MRRNKIQRFGLIALTTILLNCAFLWNPAASLGQQYLETDEGWLTLQQNLSAGKENGVTTAPVSNSGSNYPSKGAIKLDLQVNEDSSVYTETRIVNLKNLIASELEPFVKNGLSTYGSVQTNGNINALIVTDREPKLGDLIRFIERMDEMGKKNFVALETEVFSLKNVAASSLQNIVKSRLSSDGIVNADDALNVLVITDVRGKIDYVKEIIDQLDAPPRQFVIEAQILEVFDMDFENVGIDPNIFNAVELDLDFYRRIEQSTTYLSRAKYKTSSIGINSYPLGNIINILTGSGKARMYASPKIVTVNNKTALISISPLSSQNYYNPYNPDSYASQISLSVKPYMGKNGLITLEVNAQSGQHEMMSTILHSEGAENTRATPDALYSNMVSSTLMVHEGRTVAVGGLTYNYKTNIKKKTPLLGDIPLIGKAFQKNVEFEGTSQFLIFLTPRLVEPGDPTPSQEELETMKANEG